MLLKLVSFTVTLGVLSKYGFRDTIFFLLTPTQPLINQIFFENLQYIPGCIPWARHVNLELEYPIKLNWPKNWNRISETFSRFWNSKMFKQDIPAKLRGRIILEYIIHMRTFTVSTVWKPWSRVSVCTSAIPNAHSTSIAIESAAPLILISSIVHPRSFWIGSCTCACDQMIP